MKKIAILTTIFFAQLMYGMEQIHNTMVEYIDNDHVVENQLFSDKLLNESGFIQKLLISRTDKLIQLDAKSMHGISLSELHTIMNILSTKQSKQEKEEVVLAFLNSLPNKVDYPPFNGKLSAIERQRERKAIELKNRELKYAPPLKAIALVQVAGNLDMSSVEAACIKMLAGYLLKHYNGGIPVSLPDPHRKQFLDALYSLPINIQNKISHLFLMDLPHSGDLINKFNLLFAEKTTKTIPHTEGIINFDWSHDSRYLFYVENPVFNEWNKARMANLPFNKRNEPVESLKLPYGRWDSQTGERALIEPNEYKFTVQSTNIISAKSPNGEYIANFEKDNKIRLLDAQTNQLLETFIFSNLPKKDRVASKLLWSPDNKKLAAGNYLASFDVWDGGVKVYLVDLLFQLRQELFFIPLNQLFFLIDLVEAQAYKGRQFKTWTNNKIVFNEEQKAQFEALPEGLKIILKDKIAQFNPKGNFYY